MRAPSPGGPCKCLAAGGRPAHIPRVTGPRHDSAVTDGSLRFGELAPHPRLGGLVERHWTLEVRTTPAAVRVRPDALVDLVFDLGEPVTAWIAGPRLSPIEYTHTRLTRLLGVSLRAPGALAVLGAPAGALTPEWQPLSDVLGPVAEALSEALGREPTLEGRIGLLEVFLGARLAAAPVDAWVASAVGETISADGLLEILAQRSPRRNELAQPDPLLPGLAGGGAEALRPHRPGRGSPPSHGRRRRPGGAGRRARVRGPGRAGAGAARVHGRARAGAGRAAARARRRGRAVSPTRAHFAGSSAALLPTREEHGAGRARGLAQHLVLALHAQSVAFLTIVPSALAGWDWLELGGVRHTCPATGASGAPPSRASRPCHSADSPEARAPRRSTSR